MHQEWLTLAMLHRCVVPTDRGGSVFHHRLVFDVCQNSPPPHPLTLLHVQADKQLETDTGEGTAGQKAHVLHALQSQMHSVTVRSAMRLGET